MDSSLGNKKIMARNIQKYLDANNVTRKELAAAIDAPYTTVCGWLGAKSYPRIDKIERMANFFGVQKKDLVEDEIGITPEKIEKILEQTKRIPHEDHQEEIEILRTLHRREEMKILFSSVQGMTREEILAIANMAKALKGGD